MDWGGEWEGNRKGIGRNGKGRVKGDIGRNRYGRKGALDRENSKSGYWNREVREMRRNGMGVKWVNFG